ncbi:MAG TPA: hypothetical protein VE057_15195 [Archangium sp.]|nr:hypothetical protein [Archangium sp.]
MRQVECWRQEHPESTRLTLIVPLGLAREREHILRLLTARGVHVDEAARQRILTYTDLDTLDRWFDRSLNATTLSDVLDDLAQ